MIFITVNYFKYEISFSYRILACVTFYVLFRFYQIDESISKDFDTHFLFKLRRTLMLIYE